jgi:hypothetical protein
MRQFAALALVPALILAAAKPALACGDSGEFGDVDQVVVPQDRTSLILAEARELELEARDADAEATSATRNARRLTLEARALQQRAFSREGVELVSLLDRARSMAMQAGQERRRAMQQQRLASNLRARARMLRRELGQNVGFRPVRHRPMAFQL